MGTPGRNAARVIISDFKRFDAQRLLNLVRPRST